MSFSASAMVAGVISGPTEGPVPNAGRHARAARRAKATGPAARRRGGRGQGGAGQAEGGPLRGRRGVQCSWRDCGRSETGSATAAAQSRTQTRKGCELPSIWYDSGMKSAIDKAGRVVIPSEIRRRAGLQPGTELEIVLEDDASVRLVRDAPGPRLHRVGRRLVARPTAKRDRCRTSTSWPCSKKSATAGRGSRAGRLEGRVPRYERDPARPHRLRGEVRGRRSACSRPSPPAAWVARGRPGTAAWSSTRWPRACRRSSA